ncbi:MAG: hypothetical protein WCO60_17030 [Verrucomicrobiota bacterium]
MSSQTAACTTITLSYWENALAVRHSFLQQHPESEFYILVVDGPDPNLVVPPGVRVMWGKDLPVEGFLSYAMRYNAMELITSLKAPFMRLLLETYDKVLHLDADVLVYDRLDLLFKRLDSSAVVLIPHLTCPLPDHYQPGEATFLLAADYNSGFIGFNASQEAKRALLWLEERCREACYDDSTTGFCTDQKWYNLLPTLFSGVFIERSREFNVAYWNLHERQLIHRDGKWWVNNERPLAFFHFSGCSPRDPDLLTKYASRYDLTNRPELRPLVEGYFAALKQQGWPASLDLPNRFECFSDGSPISMASRQLYAISDFCHSGDDPFDADGVFFAFCQKWNLFGKQHEAMGANRWTTKHEDPRLRVIRGLFRMVLRFFGPSYYAKMMNHLQWVTSTRNQALIFFPQKSKPPL